MTEKYNQQLKDLSKELVTTERFNKLAIGLGQLTLEYPDLPETYAMHGEH